MISIINYGLGNLGSIRNMFKKIGYESRIVESPEELESATKIILPGVGAFDTGMKNLQDGKWIDSLNRRVLIDKVPVLGICLGMQLMCRKSEEGKMQGLSWIDADAKKFKFEDKSLKIPHMGWNECIAKKESNLIDNDFNERRFYFVHSYYVDTDLPTDVLFETQYGGKFTSAFEKDNIIGMQFHPEKSHKFGLSILKNFAEKY